MIAISNMSAGYNNTAAITADSLNIPNASISSVIGANGSGKSTLLKAISGQLKYSGTITIDGEEINSLSHTARAKTIAYLPQHLMAPRMRVSTLVSHGRYAYSNISHNLSANDKELIAYALELADVSSLRDRYIEELSGGERSRAYLAMIIAQDSDYILLDEPSSDYDVSHQHMIVHILDKLSSSGKGIVICSHDIPLSMTISDSIIMLRAGKVITVTSPKELTIDDSPLRECIDVGIAVSDRDDSLYQYQLIK